MSKEEWESIGELDRIQLKDRGVERNFWHGNGAYLTQCLLEGRQEELRSFVQEALNSGEIEAAYEIRLQEGSPVAELLLALP